MCFSSQNGFDYLLTYSDDPQTVFPRYCVSWMVSSGELFSSLKLVRAASNDTLYKYKKRGQCEHPNLVLFRCRTKNGNNRKGEAASTLKCIHSRFQVFIAMFRPANQGPDEHLVIEIL